MDWYWGGVLSKITDYSTIQPYEDDFIRFTISLHLQSEEINSYSELQKFIAKHNEYQEHQALKFNFKNMFWRHISEKSSLHNWLDIENEYYTLLKDFLRESRRYNSCGSVEELNEEFRQVKNLLEKYLTEVCKQEVKPKKYILTDIIAANIRYKDVAISKRNVFLDSIADEKERMRTMVMNDRTPEYSHLRRKSDTQLNQEIEESIKKSGIEVPYTLLLNFNYTDTVRKLFGKPAEDYDYEDYDCDERPIYDIINIHGELNSKENPIIFGHGDELDEDYRAIERMQDKCFLENIKSIRYNDTINYRRLLGFLYSNPYQVVILGHSCGNFDRTLLNTIFENENCISIKPFYWDKGNNENNYTELMMNISRNFNNKQNMRDIVVNKEFCKPLIPVQQ
jgi:hypothetical protein